MQRCGECKACLIVEKAKGLMLRPKIVCASKEGVQVGPKRYMHQVGIGIVGADDDMVNLWNEILRDNPCEGWTNENPQD